MELCPHRMTIVVSEMERSLQFYRDQLGMTVSRDVVREGPSYDEITGIPDVKLRVVFLQTSNGGYFLELVEYLRPQKSKRPMKESPNGAVRLCFSVSALKRSLLTLRRRGVKSYRGPITLERDGVCVANLLYLRDPDGFEIELIEMVQ